MKTTSRTLPRIMFVSALLFAALPAFPANAKKLNAEENQALEQTGSSSNMKQWFDRITLSGYAAPGFIQSGSTRSDISHGHFWLKEAELDIKARIWDDVIANIEWFPVPPHAFNDPILVPPTTLLGAGTFMGEIYVDFKNIVKFGDGNYVGLKLGRVDIPYGAEYTWQHSPQNPLITRGAAWLWGWDEGVEAYGKVWKLNWIASVLDGDFVKTTDSTGDKSYTIKVSSDVTERLTLSASYMKIAETALGSMIQGQRPMIPPSGTLTKGHLFEFSGVYTHGSLGQLTGEWGRWFVSNTDSGATSNLMYFLAEPLVNVTNELYAAFRYSAIGTFDNDAGYILNDGMTVLNGVANANIFTRIAGGVGYRLNPNTTLKLEVSRDSFSVSSNSALVANNRNMIACEATVKF